MEIADDLDVALNQFHHANLVSRPKRRFEEVARKADPASATDARRADHPSWSACQRKEAATDCHACWRIPVRLGLQNRYNSLRFILCRKGWFARIARSLNETCPPTKSRSQTFQAQIRLYPRFLWVVAQTVIEDGVPIVVQVSEGATSVGFFPRALRNRNIDARRNRRLTGSLAARICHSGRMGCALRPAIMGRTSANDLRNSERILFQRPRERP